MKYDYLIGVDPGTRTGIAVWSVKHQQLVSVYTSGAVEAMAIVAEMFGRGESIKIRFEDSRLRKWFGTAGRERLQGVGSIKRDSAIWSEFCTFYAIPFDAVKPSAGSTKWSAEKFRKITGWDKRTSEHSRDAALLVFGIK